MKINPYSYPYPVLYNAHDDVLGKFEVDYELNELTKTINLNLKIDNAIIEKMLKRKEAKIICHLEASASSYRELIEIESQVVDIKIDTKNINGDLEVNTMIVADKDIGRYINAFDPAVYPEGYAILNIEQGMPLAVSDTYIVNIEKDDHQLEDIPSIMNVGKTKGKHMEIDIDDDTILLKLPDKDYEDYTLLSKTSFPMQNIIMNATIFPALVLVIEKMAINNSEPIDRELNWYKVLEQKMQENHIEISDINETHSSLKIAQILLENPISRAFESGKELIVDDE